MRCAAIQAPALPDRPAHLRSHTAGVTSHWCSVRLPDNDPANSLCRADQVSSSVPTRKTQAGCAHARWSCVSRVVIDARRPLDRRSLPGAIATGAQVVVHTDDPHRWRPMQTAVDRPDRPGLAPGKQPPRTAGAGGGLTDPFHLRLTWVTPISSLCELADRQTGTPARRCIRQDRPAPSWHHRQNRGLHCSRV